MIGSVRCLSHRRPLIDAGSSYSTDLKLVFRSSLDHLWSSVDPRIFSHRRRDLQSRRDGPRHRRQAGERQILPGQSIQRDGSPPITSIVLSFLDIPALGLHAPGRRGFVSALSSRMVSPPGKTALLAILPRRPQRPQVRARGNVPSFTVPVFTPPQT